MRLRVALLHHVNPRIVASSPELFYIHCGLLQFVREEKCKAEAGGRGSRAAGTGLPQKV